MESARTPRLALALVALAPLAPAAAAEPPSGDSPSGPTEGAGTGDAPLRIVDDSPWATALGSAGLDSPRVVTLRVSAAAERLHPAYIFLYIGLRQLQNDDWSGVDSQLEFGITFDHELAGGALSIDLGIWYSFDDASVRQPNGNLSRIDADLWEFDIGLLKRFAPGSGLAQPYVGGGLALVNAGGRLDDGVVVNGGRDWGFGGYLRAGVAFEAWDNGLIGLDLRYLGLTEVSIGGLETDVDGGSATISFGYGI